MTLKRIITKPNKKDDFFPMVCKTCGKEFDVDHLPEMGAHLGTHYTKNTNSPNRSWNTNYDK